VGPRATHLITAATYGGSVQYLYKVEHKNILAQWFGIQITSHSST